MNTLGKRDALRWKITGLYFVLFIVTYFLFRNTAYLNDILFVLTAIPLVAIAVEHDKIVQPSITLYYLLVGMGVAALSAFMAYAQADIESTLLIVGGRMVLCFLILQKILRFIFVKLWKREPEFRGAEFNLPNMSYTFLLTIGTLLLSILELML